jgi:hypothetical protein
MPTVRLIIAVIASALLPCVFGKTTAAVVVVAAPNTPVYIVTPLTTQSTDTLQKEPYPYNLEYTHISHPVKDIIQ